MEKLIIIKYAELNTKKSNINYFIKILKDNIKKTLEGIDANIHFDKGRMFIESSNERRAFQLKHIKNENDMVYFETEIELE